MSATALTGFVDGVGLLGPGLADWPAGIRVLAGETPWASAPTVLPQLQCLPGAERRRTGAPVKIALTVGLEASLRAGADPAQLPAVFTSSGADGQNLHEICEALASAERLISPTRFHNSVHNAAAGYWGIATGGTAASNALCAYDGSFAAGLLEALTQVVIEQRSVLLVAYDTGYPDPIRRMRPIPDAFAVALVLAPAAQAASLARLEVRLSDAPAAHMGAPALDSLRRAIPAARCLPLLAQLARRGSSEAVLDYLDHLRLAVKVRPCR